MLKYAPMTPSDQFHSYIKDCKTIFITASRPLDLDCVASSLLLKKHLEQLGKKVKAKFPKKFLQSQIEFYNHLPYFSELENGDTAQDLKKQNFDCLILVDGSSWGQFHQEVGKSDIPVPQSFKKSIQIDHHNQKSLLGDLAIINSKASSTAEVILMQIIPEDKITPEIATLAYSAIIGDTGNFRWETTPQTLRLGAMLLEKGAKPEETIEKYFFSKSKTHMEMTAYAINNTRYRDDLKSTFLLMPYSKIEKDGISEEELHELGVTFTLNIAYAVRGYPRGFYVEEEEPGIISISSRGSNVYNKISLPEVLADVTPSSGGHFNAAGAKLKGDFDVTVQSLIKALQSTL